MSEEKGHEISSVPAELYNSTKDNSTKESEQEPPRQFEPYIHGVRPGTSSQVTPRKHVNMFIKHFTSENVQKGIEYVKTQGSSLAPIFMVVDTRGSWKAEKNKLLWWWII